nr:MAG: major capsid protein [Gokushovirinae sp.]
MAKTSVRRADSAKQFVQLPKTQIPRSIFNRSHGYKTAMPVSKLVPFFVDEALPGDTFKLSTALLARLSTPIVPFMDNLYLRTFYFFVPTRLVMDHWEALNGDQRSGPTAKTDYLVPQATINNLGIGTLGDYLGLPTGVAKDVKVSELPLRCISLIWNEWFRDENLQNAYNIDKNTDREYAGDQSISAALVNNPLLYSSECPPIAKKHDYFTSCLPWPQKGPGVEISLGGSVPLTGASIASSGPMSFSVGSAGNAFSAGHFYATTAQPQDGNVTVPKTTGSAGQAIYSPLTYQSGLSLSGGTVDLSQSTPISINDLRQAFQVQKLYERDARGGTRYTEILRSHFGVISPDARLQRPEYLGGGKSRINVNPVQQTSATAEGSGTPQGNLSAYAVGFDTRHSFTKSFVEHGFVIGFVAIQSDLTYQQGLNRMWSRKARFDFYWPVFAHLGEQAVLNKEIYCQGTAKDDEVFGYQERYAEYRYYPSLITGHMRSTSSTPLDVWHLAEKFENLPTLSAEFIRDATPIQRVVAVTDEPPIILDAWFDLRCVRPMPIYSTPGLVDHF